VTTGKPAGGLMDAFGTIIAEKLLPKLVELLWPKFVQLFEEVLLPKMTALFPLFAASVAKAVVDNLPGVNLIKPIESIVDQVRDDVNVAIPDFDIPGLSDKFDLTEFINKVLGK